nr:hypothetical protein [Tanacetum cinerariifolium]
MVCLDILYNFCPPVLNTQLCIVPILIPERAQGDTSDCVKRNLKPDTEIMWDVSVGIKRLHDDLRVTTAQKLRLLKDED